MKTSKYFFRKTKSATVNSNVPNKSYELTHPKLEITVTLDASGSKKTPHPLLRHMYSQENEVLFI